ncbi:MAG: site-specific DNA-methyltransferase [Exilispira sp.]|nr:site-specific DNA-methyltransferase [Exilispira sp.]
MNNKNNDQTITKAKGRPMLTWVGKKPLDKIEYYPAQEKEVYGDKSSKELNKLFWGDNLQVLAHLLKDYRGKIDLIYIDPPFDSKAEYIKKVKLRGLELDGLQQNLLEEKQYTDIWENDEYLQFMYERLLIVRELLADTGSFYIHLDWHKSSYLRLIIDEIFGESNFINEISWCYTQGGRPDVGFPNKHDTIYFYAKDKKNLFFNVGGIKIPYELVSSKSSSSFTKVDENGRKYKEIFGAGKKKLYRYYEDEGKIPFDWWTDIPKFTGRTAASDKGENENYPTQKPEKLLERIIKASSKENDIVMDCFCGSGTALAVAQKLGRKWIGCDINIGAIQTTTKRLAKIIEDQQKEKKGLMAFKIYNVNDYDIFKNEVEAKEIIMNMYGIEPIKRSYFDGTLDNNFVKVMPMNRVLNKLDVKEVIKNTQDSIDNFTVKTSSKAGESTYEQGVVIICSGAEIDINSFLRQENNTGVKIEVRDVLTEKKSLIFKKKPEAKIEVKAEGKKLTVTIQDFCSPILIRKLELENEKIKDDKAKAKVEDFKQVIDSVAIDVDYNGELFNAEIMDLPDKKEVIKAVYNWDYPKSGKNTVAIKIVDVLGEEYFETFPLDIK